MLCLDLLIKVRNLVKVQRVQKLRKLTPAENTSKTKAKESGLNAKIWYINC